MRVDFLLRRNKETEDNREQIAARDINRVNQESFESRALNSFHASRIYFGAQRSSGSLGSRSLLGIQGRKTDSSDQRNGTGRKINRKHLCWGNG